MLTPTRLNFEIQTGNNLEIVLTKSNNGKTKNKSGLYSLEHYLPAEQVNVMAPYHEIKDSLNPWKESGMDGTVVET